MVSIEEQRLSSSSSSSSYSVRDLGNFSVALIFILLLLVPLSPALFILLVISFLVTRLLQFIRYGDAYDYVIQLKCFIRIGICLIGILFTGFIKLVLTYTSFNLNNIDYSVKFLGFPILIWLEIPYKIISLFLWSLILSFTYIIIPVVPLDLKGSGRNVPEAVHELTVSLLAFWWPNLFTFLEIVKPNCEIQNILGLCTREWIKLPFFALTTYNVITLSTHMTVWLLPKLVPLKHRLQFLRNSIFEIIARKFLITENQVYWVNGTKHCINFIFTSLMFLLTWVLYFGPLLNETLEGEKLLEFGIWTCFSLIICAILWFMKTCVILLWEAGSVYNRLNHKIIQGGKQLYFLGIMGRDKYDIFNLLCDRIPKKGHENKSSLEHYNLISSFALIIFYPVLATNPYSFYHSRFDNMDELGNGNKVCTKRKKRVKDDLLMQEFDQSKYLIRRKRPLFSTMHGLQKVAQYLLSAKQALVKEKYTSDILQNVMQNEVIVNGDITRKLKELFGDDDWKEFKRQLEDDEYNVKNIEMWMEKARNNCLLLGNTLSSAKEVVDCLNITISSLIIFATFIMWLLLTGLATTKLVASITTPLLALTFIFKNTCKTLFEGIIFAYVVHPFSVGDLCIIDETMMEVTTVGLWKTTFSKVGTQEEVIYPNSELSSKCIINHKTDFDWNDYVELRVDSLKNDKISCLKQKIEKFLSQEKEKFTPNYNSVEMLTTGENFKIKVNFRHNVNLKNKSYFECLKIKRRLRSELILKLQLIKNEISG